MRYSLQIDVYLYLTYCYAELAVSSLSSFFFLSSFCASIKMRCLNWWLKHSVAQGSGLCDDNGGRTDNRTPSSPPPLWKPRQRGMDFRLSANEEMRIGERNHQSCNN